MRINKLLSNYGYCSRKEANKLIQDKRVIVNGELAIEGQWVEETDTILLDNVRVKPKDKVYVAFNKPVGIVCTAAKYSLQGTTQGNGLTGGLPPVRFSM